MSMNKQRIPTLAIITNVANHETTCSADFYMVYLSSDPPVPLFSLLYNERRNTSFVKYGIKVAQICQNTHAIDKTDPFLKKTLQHWDLKRFSIFNRCRQTPIKTPLAGCWHEADFGNCRSYLSETHMRTLTPHNRKPNPRAFSATFSSGGLDGSHTPHSPTDLLILFLQVLSWWFIQWL